MLAALRNPPESVNSEQERRRRELTIRMNQLALIDLTNNEASKLLVQGHYETAIPGALQSLKLGIEVYGKGHIELVPSYLLLAEANMGIQRYRPAEEFLSLAKWSIYKNPESSGPMRSPLHRLFGKLYLSQGRPTEALQQLAEDVYYSSLKSGPEHFETAGGYFQIGLVFLNQDRIEQCLALFDKVVDIWYKFLTGIRVSDYESISDVLSEAQIGEAADILRSIVDSRSEFLGAQHIATGEVSYVLGILCDLTGHFEKAQQFYAASLQIYEVQVGSEHDLSMDIRASLMAVEDMIATAALRGKQANGRQILRDVPGKQGDAAHL